MLHHWAHLLVSPFPRSLDLEAGTTSTSYRPVYTQSDLGATPVFGHLSTFPPAWMAGGAARQPLWTASASSARPWQHVTAPSIHLGGNSEQATCRPPSRGPPPRRDARASDLLDFDTASGLHACTKFSHAGTQFSQHGTTMMFQEPSCRSRLSHS